MRQKRLKVKDGHCIAFNFLPFGRQKSPSPRLHRAGSFLLLIFLPYLLSFRLKQRQMPQRDHILAGGALGKYRQHRCDGSPYFLHQL